MSLGTAASTLGGLVFCLSGFMVAWLGHLHTNVALFLPAFFWIVERTAEKPNLRNNGLMALFVGCALLAGHLQTAVHVAIGVAAYTAFRWRFAVGGTQLTLRGLSQIASGVALGVLFAMPQLLPFFDYLRTSSGAVVLEQLETVAPVNSLDAAVLSVDPGHFGSPAVAQGYGPYTGPSGRNLNYNELIGGYVGRLALGLALLAAGFALPRRRRTSAAFASAATARPAALFFVAFALFAAAVAWQLWPVYDLMHAIPKLKSTKLMRFSLLFAFALATLAAYGLEVLLAFVAARRAAAGPGHGDASRLATCTFAGVAIVVVTLELLAFDRGYNPAIEATEIAPRTTVTDYLRAQLPPDGKPATWRALGIDNTILLPSANLFYDIPMVSGYDSMEARTTTELVALMSSDPGGAYFIKEIGHFDRGWRIGDLLGVRYVLSPIALPAPLELVLDGPTKIYANPAARPRAFAATELRRIADKDQRLAFLASPDFQPEIAVVERTPPQLEEELAKRDEPTEEGLRLLDGAVQLESYDDLEVRLAVSIEEPKSASQAALPYGLVVLADAWDEGWVAELDDHSVPIERVDHALRGVFVGPGEHELVFRYRSPAVLVGLALGVIGLLGILAMLFLPDRDRSAGPKPPSLF